jgi:hypothetical protein
MFRNTKPEPPPIVKEVAAKLEQFNAVKPMVPPSLVERLRLEHAADVKARAAIQERMDERRKILNLIEDYPQFERVYMYLIARDKSNDPQGA